MSPLICSLLDYENTVLYIEPYGGGCRTLLSKKPHEQEIYNDFGFGLTSFFKVMADSEKTEQLIDMLLANEPSREEFDRLVIRRMSAEDRLNTSSSELLSVMALESFKRYNIGKFKDLRKQIRSEDYKGIINTLDVILHTKHIANKLEPLEELQYWHYYELYSQYWSLVVQSYEDCLEDAAIDFENAWVEDEKMALPEAGTRLAELYENGKQRYMIERAMAAVHSHTDDILTTNEEGETISDLEMAFTIFQLYYCSRDGMGQVWSAEKNKDSKAYYRAVSNLRNISERMENVTIAECDALDLIRQYRVYENVMLYLD